MITWSTVALGSREKCPDSFVLHGSFHVQGRPGAPRGRVTLGQLLFT